MKWVTCMQFGFGISDTCILHFWIKHKTGKSENSNNQEVNFFTIKVTGSILSFKKDFLKPKSSSVLIKHKLLIRIEIFSHSS
jgi:hypothetical protein